jgi:hypothetical protein
LPFVDFAAAGSALLEGREEAGRTPGRVLIGGGTVGTRSVAAVLADGGGGSAGGLLLLG